MGQGKDKKKMTILIAAVLFIVIVLYPELEALEAELRYQRIERRIND